MKEVAEWEGLERYWNWGHRRKMKGELCVTDNSYHMIKGNVQKTEAGERRVGLGESEVPATVAEQAKSGGSTVRGRVEQER